MFSKLIPAVVLTALAGRALAQTINTFNVSIGPHANILVLPNDVLNFNVASFPVIAACASNCTIAQTAITACTANNTACYCAPAVTAPLQTCEQCMFTALVVANKPAPLPLAGSNQVLGGWTTNCAAGAAATPPTTTALAAPLGLALPLDVWDGPFDSVFPTTVGWIIAVTGGVLGSSLIYMLCQM
ncbi:hypothetical protein B0H12DRAFT_1110395 [Mycena haematopus]|nr:hypothetical protein B0H12DRAFT_1110395 [Mycena haematopus]